MGKRFSLATWCYAAALIAGLPLTAAMAEPLRSPEQQALECALSPPATPLNPWFNRTSARITQGQSITIVAIGSSSTAGAGASSSAAAYPSRLEALLKAKYPSIAIRVLNRGVNGEEAPEMITRFDKDVIAERPDLIFWQVGTNAVLKRPTIADQGEIIRGGIARLKSTGADIILIDPQYAPKVIAHPEAEQMVKLISAEARHEGAGVFKRFDLMRGWYQTRHLPFKKFISPDGLHMNDWSYDCVARQLADAITSAADGFARGAMASAGTPR
ncbi:MAG TPA: GDSL-type esterase/lipase family protein [Xanthobacteraceae bacterium]|nr:GDSL-type esterase/lipase family protein [Xanthobacteraceae bacterium]